MIVTARYVPRSGASHARSWTRVAGLATGVLLLATSLTACGSSSAKHSSGGSDSGGGAATSPSAGSGGLPGSAGALAAMLPDEFARPRSLT
jgi:hypothetical protein